MFTGLLFTLIELTPIEIKELYNEIQNETQIEEQYYEEYETDDIEKILNDLIENY